VFDDSLQDDWGRRLLAQSLRFEGLTSTPPELLLRMQGRMGALVFTPTPTVTVPQATLETTSLSALLTAAAAFEAGTLERNDAFRRLIEGSSRAGGARPKRSCTKEGEWLAKSPSATGDAELDVVGLEGTCLVIAAAAGLRVPVSRPRSHGEHANAVSRAARCLRAQLLRLGARDREALRSAAGGFSMLFRHMAFNAAVGNVDDHLKNFWMLATSAGYRLAPAFYLVPDITGRTEHTLAFDYGVVCLTREQLRSVAERWSIAHADDILDQVVTAVKKFTATAKKLGVRILISRTCTSTFDAV
jgi:serine/threonine-protein kinase HipA